MCKLTAIVAPSRAPALLIDEKLTEGSHLPAVTHYRSPHLILSQHLSLSPTLAAAFAHVLPWTEKGSSLQGRSCLTPAPIGMASSKPQFLGLVGKIRLGNNILRQSWSLLFSSYLLTTLPSLL